MRQKYSDRYDVFGERKTILPASASQPSTVAFIRGDEDRPKAFNEAKSAIEQEDREYADQTNGPSLDVIYEARDRIEMEYEDIGMEAFSRRAFSLLAHAIRHMTPEQAVRLREHDKETVDFVAARPFANPHNNPALWTSYGRLHHGKPMRVSLEEAAKALPTI